MAQIPAALGALVLMLLPGCWLIMWGPTSRAFPLSARVALALLVSPVVVAAEFYVLRVVGLSFAATAAVLPLLNLPAGWPIWQAVRTMRRPDSSTVLLWTATLALPAAYLWYWMHDPAVRTNWGHAWTHADIAYMIANGQLRPEDPHLAGIRLAYPWLGHIYQAVTSYLLGASPNAAYLWTNVGVLAGAIGVTAALTGELGGGRVARATSAIWLCFGINLAFIAWWILPAGLIERLPRVWGDGRFSPWLRKFGVFEPTVFGIGLCLAILYVVARPSNDRTSWLTAVFVGLLLLFLGMTYPVLLPAGLGIIGARIVASTFVPWAVARFRHDALPVVAVNVREAFRIVLTCIAALVVTALYLRMVTVDRGPGSPVGLSTLYEAKEKAVAVVLVLLPLAVGVVLAARQAFKYPAAAVTLLGAAAACAVMNVLFDVRLYRNEYKFFFPAAAALVPLAALGFARLPERFGRAGSVTVTMLAIVLAAPGFYRRYTEIQSESERMPVDASRFEFRLQPGDRYAAAFEAILGAGPVNAVLLARRGDIDLTTVTGRAMLVPPDSGEVHGFGQGADYELKQVRGYSARIVDERRRMLFSVLDSGASVGARALEEVLAEVKRPLVILVESTDSIIAAWLPARADARLMFAGQGLQAWFISSRAPADSR